MTNDSPACKSPSAMEETVQQQQPRRTQSSIISEFMDDVGYKLGRFTDSIESQVRDSMTSMTNMMRRLSTAVDELKFECASNQRALNALLEMSRISDIERYRRTSDMSNVYERMSSKVSELEQQLSRLSIGPPAPPMIYHHTYPAPHQQMMARPYAPPPPPPPQYVMQQQQQATAIPRWYAPPAEAAKQRNRPPSPPSLPAIINPSPFSNIVKQREDGRFALNRESDEEDRESCDEDEEEEEDDEESTDEDTVSAPSEVAKKPFVHTSSSQKTVFAFPPQSSSVPNIFNAPAANNGTPSIFGSTSVFGKPTPEKKTQLFGTKPAPTPTTIFGANKPASTTFSFSDLAKAATGSVNITAAASSSSASKQPSSNIFGTSAPAPAPAPTKPLFDSENGTGGTEERTDDYEPIINMPSSVKLITGEEGHETLFQSEHSILYRFESTAQAKSEWKECGRGVIKVNVDDKKKYRILFRREQVLKLAANHVIDSKVKFITRNNRANCICWFALDFAIEPNGKMEKFCVKFKAPTDPAKFLKACRQCGAEIPDVPDVVEIAKKEGKN